MNETGDRLRHDRGLLLFATPCTVDRMTNDMMTFLRLHFLVTVHLTSQQ